MRRVDRTWGSSMPVSDIMGALLLSLLSNAVLLGWLPKDDDEGRELLSMMRESASGAALAAQDADSRIIDNS